MEDITVHNLSERGLAGYMELILDKKKERTKAKKSYTVGASKISPAIYLDDENTPCYYLVQLGGGLLAGENYKNHIELEEGARAILTTQAPTKIYKNEKNEPSKQFSKIKLNSNSVLEYINDSVILYKDAIYEQKVEIYLEENTTLIYSDGITSGWSPDGKEFQYTSSRMKTQIFLGENLIFSDNLRIVPKEYDVQSFGILEGYKNFGTLIIIDKNITKEVVGELKKLLENSSIQVKFGISQLEVSGLIMRVLGDITQDIQKIIDIAHNYFREKFLNSNSLNLRKL